MNNPKWVAYCAGLSTSEKVTIDGKKYGSMREKVDIYIHRQHGSKNEEGKCLLLIRGGGGVYLCAE